MKTINIIFCLGLGALLIQVGRAATEFPENGVHHITHVPVTISFPGIYVVDKDLVFTAIPGGHAYDRDNGTAIQINASNVVLDLEWHSLSDPATYADGQSIGISLGNSGTSSSPSRQVANVAVVNGTLNGFSWGIEGYGTNLVVSNVAFNYQGWASAELEGVSTLIDHCISYSLSRSKTGEILFTGILGDSNAFRAWEVRNSLVEYCDYGVALYVTHLAIGNTLKYCYIGIILQTSTGATEVNNTLIHVVYPN
jgi:hypothetical protein